MLPSPVPILTPLVNNFTATNMGLTLWSGVGASVGHVARSPNIKTLSRAEPLPNPDHALLPQPWGLTGPGPSFTAQGRDSGQDRKVALL